MYPSILKYVSGFNLPIHWIRTPNNLPPSKAGIGKTLKIAKAREIIPANAKNNFHHQSCKSVSPNLTAPTGPLNLLIAQSILSLLKENKLAQRFHKEVNVSCVSHLISWKLAIIACPNGNLISDQIFSCDIQL